MFGSWKKGPAVPLGNSPSPKQRSIPIPFKGHENANDFKTSSTPQSSDPTAAAKAEFSVIKPKVSVQSLRKFVRGIAPRGGVDPDTKGESSQSPAEFPNQDENTQPNNETPKEQKRDRWFWPGFNKNQKPEEAPRAWAFWPKENNHIRESGALAVSGTGTEQELRSSELTTPNPKLQREFAPSIVVPQFSSVRNPSRTSRLANYLWPTNKFKSTTKQAPIRLKRAVVIGVHGYFPAKMTRAILGEPTGTSIKFANEAEIRLHHWFDEHFRNQSFKVDKIALEGEGKIQFRVEKLYKLLLNWESLLREADFVFFASHSQGSVVTVAMVSKLIEAGILTRKQRVSVLSMAGSILGPMPGMDQTLVVRAITRFEHDSLSELFQLQNPGSNLSRELQKSFSRALSFGAKITLVSSADDQLIPIYSALATCIRHPNLFRAVYIDGDDVVPDFIAPLLQLAAVQLNEGQTDHGVISELSGILSGALTSKGHSKLYSSSAVYDLGLQMALETSVSVNCEPTFDTEFRIPKPAGNPYILPWAVNALVSDSRNSRHLLIVVDELHEQFQAWKPVSRQMRDLKTRLAGMRRLSKL